YGAHYRDWLPNVLAPGAFARHIATVHVPRRFYVEALPGIPTIRVFEALACGIPLLSAPWEDSEGLFRTGEDYLLARTEAEMYTHMRAVAQDRELAASLATNGLMTIRERHSCAHRAAELITIVSRLRSDAMLEVAR
ncbi:MAG: glycosyltransferase, partial [Hyphomicrobiales bacterium]|nr:glycosyltransferase [Hyphomicrobiales bacterium]